MGSFHCGLVHKPGFLQEALKKPEAKAAAHDEWDMRKKTWDAKKVRSKPEVARQTKNDGKTLHFANLINSCHLKNAELTKHLQKYKERVVLMVKTTSKTMKDTEQNPQSKVALASQMAAAELLDTVRSSPDCFACRRKNVLKFGSEFFNDKDQKVGRILKTPWYLLKGTCMVTD